MRILFISPRQCWPLAGGGKIREYNFARSLGERSDLTYIFFREPVFEAPAPADMPFCRQIIPVPAPRAYSIDRLLRGLTGPWPLPVLNYTTAEMKDAIRRAAAGGSFDAVHFDGTHLAAYAPLVRSLLPRAHICFNWHNIESEGMQRFAILSSSMAKRLYARLTTRRWLSAERELLREPYVNIVCSERERKLLAQMVPSSRLEVIENGVDTAYFENAGAGAGGHRILFVGLMAYHANIDAAVWFTRHIWPALRRALPDKVLTIVGAKPAPAVLALGKEPGVEVTGTVPDVRPYYSEAFAAVAPLRTGAGTRLKILEAMAAGVPVVSTRLGAEGLHCSPGSDILLAGEGADDWTSAFARLSSDEFRRQLIAAGRRLVCSRYDWAILRESIHNTYMRMLNVAPARHL
jgi:glycosyltransferase involved in cell wall biosynthesis